MSTETATITTETAVQAPAAPEITPPGPTLEERTAAFKTTSFGGRTRRKG